VTRPLDGKVALVTGAARDRGIGRGICLALARRGADVAVHDLTHEDEAARRAAELEDLGVKACFVPADITQPEENERLVAEVVERLGRLDVFVANAGVARWMRLADVTREDWDAIMDVNLHGVLYGCQAAAAQMRRQGEGGRIVVTTSVNAVMPFSPLGIYGASKHAAGLLVGVLAREWAEDGISVNHIGPGWVDTNINDRSPDFDTAEKREAALSSIPFGHRPADPAELGEAVAYLACSTYTTGAFLRVDGGLTVSKY
jgi:NAD(P)-dependent dehydrogenase (short-subunit alcohol dehydrogenase family)